MKKYSLLLLIPVFSSCCGLHTEVKYEYGEAVVTRIDECGKTTFYYGNGQSRSSGRIWTEYSGINDGFSGYLIFSESGKVKILSGDGHFQSEGVDTTLFEYKRITASNRPESKESLYRIMLSTRYEQERNKQSNSQVKAFYVIDENEWW
ncbi:hypothetical protein ACSX1A_13330 [Pontibacter sp. MBLB2868]|uniref:hypothetical protein n=1 Tax=Pontibacter sp. MBLB2868 TaxID=3451555 RepID=UPI003F74D1B5